MRHRARLATLVFAERDGRVLLRRNPVAASRFPGLWNGLGGHVDAGEDIAASARREVREEASIAVEALRLRLVLHEAALEGEAYVIFVFAAKARRGEPVAEPGSEVRFASREELADLDVVPDLFPILEVVRGTGPVGFGFQQFDGADGSVRLAIDGRSVTLGRDA